MNDTSRCTYYYITCITSETFTGRPYLSCIWTDVHMVCWRRSKRSKTSRNWVSIVRSRRRQSYLAKPLFEKHFCWFHYDTGATFFFLFYFKLLRGRGVFFDIYFGITNSWTRLFGMYLFTKNPIRAHSLLQREKCFWIFFNSFRGDPK